MTNRDTLNQTGLLGDLPPLNASVSRMPDKRQVSLRWLSGTVLVGVTSLFLMGGALYGALEGREQLALPAQAYERSADSVRSGEAIARGDRPGISFNADASSTGVMMVSTVSREDDRDLVKVRPFLHVATPLAVAPKSEFDYPPFDALAVFSDNGKPERVARSSGLIYGAEVESEVALKVADFDPAHGRLSKVARQRTADIEEMVRNAAPTLDGTATSIASVNYVDPGRFSLQNSALLSPTGVTITAENVTFRSKVSSLEGYDGLHYVERIVRIREETEIAAALQGEGIGEDESLLLAKVLSSDLGGTVLQPDDRLRLSLEIDGARAPSLPHVRLASVYRNATHLVSVARTDTNRYVYATEPAAIPQIAAAGAGPERVVGRMPTVYDAIYRASLTEGLSKDIARKLVRIFSSDVDFNATISPRDELSVFVSLDEKTKKPTEDSEILFAAIKLGSVTRKFYRFRDRETGSVDYYDENGKSVRKFLLRQPVPGAKFRSPFGMRWHPILKYKKMHWGVDWSAPRGTPIIAAGDGVVERAGWNKGYGRQTILRHANGYKTSYNHQTRIAKDVVPGARVRQGQIIGYVGSTGLSTGPHLHYEVIVNDTKVDPMRIRLPKGKVLEGDELVAFNAERERIDDLLSPAEETRVAQY